MAKDVIVQLRGVADSTGQIKKIINANGEEASPIPSYTSAGLAAIGGPASLGGSSTAPVLAFVDGALSKSDGSALLKTDQLKTEADIRAAALFLSNNGGGVVKIAAGVISITSTLPLYNGVTYKGVGNRLKSGSLTGLDATNGTIIQPVNNTFPAFSCNDISEKYGVGVNPNVTQIYNDISRNVGVEGLGISGGSYGIKIGGYRTPGAMYSKIDNVYCTGQSSWGIWLENCGHMHISRARVDDIDATNGIGGIMILASAGGAYNFGNSTLIDVGSAPGGSAKYKRGIVVAAINNSAINDINAFKLDCVPPGSLIDYTNVTGSASSPDLVMQVGTNMARLPVGMPVYFTAVFGSSSFQTWFIVYSDAPSRTIRVSSTVNGTPINTATSSVIGLRTYGYPCFEIVADAGSTVQQYHFSGTDVEGPAGALIVVQNAIGHLDIGTVSKGHGTDHASVLCARGACGGQFTSTDSIQTDIDGTAVANLYSAGCRIDNSDGFGITDQSPRGLLNVVGGSITGIGQNIGGSNSVPIAVKGLFVPGLGQIYPNLPFGARGLTSTSTTLSLSAAHANTIAFTGTGPATWTLPALTNSASGTDGAYQGLVFHIVNAGTGILTLNTSSSQLINKIAAKTSISIPAGASVQIVGMYDGTTAFWAWIANNGAT